MSIFKRCILAFFSIFSVICLFASCSHKDEDINEEKPVVHVVNGLSLEARLANPEKRLVEVTWKNMQDTDLILTLTKRITSDSGKALSWPGFDIRFDQVPESLSPVAFFAGFVTFGDKSVELIEVLKLNGLPLVQTELPVERIEWIRLAPGEQVSALFDLGSLFDGVPDKEVDSVKVLFRYECKGREHKGDEYWRGYLESNSLELRR